MATDLSAISALFKVLITLQATHETYDSLATGLHASGFPQDQINVNESHSPTLGSSDDQINEYWCDRRMLAASATEDLDFAGTETNAFGKTLAMSKVKAIFIHNTSDDQGTPTDAAMTIGGGDGTDFLGPLGAAAHTITLEAGQWMAVTCMKDGWACGAGVADLLKILNDDAVDQLQYDIVVLGLAA